ncbi:RrF2 family transcriptional regulator [Anaeromicropila herbilytica]|uniref:AsnC family transcriptional regulator n=1 Tax=Anaeromicropila herbilytica TaxID=2785025 RepID=A0A7R7EML4_9FIRM|nr:RrF2 family transcriptional regulator [Anaeromicropila herbilytica]BCN31599.1 AsnC family transcriptional regulator [Anaeromicropila herbilytica]
MKLSTKGRYGLRAVVDLALNSESEAVSLSSVAERQSISISYLEQLIAKLKKAGIVNSIRGAQGGYVLAKSADQISVGDILRALEGDLNPVDCAEIMGGDTTCSSSDLCVTKYVWKRISDSINSAVDEILLSELVKESKAVHGNSCSENDKKKETKTACGKQI